jgi:hypothetical protein
VRPSSPRIPSQGYPHCPAVVWGRIPLGLFVPLVTLVSLMSGSDLNVAHLILGVGAAGASRLPVQWWLLRTVPRLAGFSLFRLTGRGSA